MVVERPMRKRSCSSVATWLLADQFGRCSLTEVKEEAASPQPQPQPLTPPGAGVYQRRSSAHALDSHPRRHHHPYMAPVRIATPPLAMEPHQIAHNAIGNDNNHNLLENADQLSRYADYDASQSYCSYNMAKSSLYFMNKRTMASPKYSSVAAAANVYLSRRGRRNAIGSATHELVLTRRVCRQMPA
jgi:hypothetical protein